jgi:phage terminase large subunit
MAEVVMPAQGFIPRSYQLGFWKFMQHGGRKAVLCYPRRHGKDILSLNWMACASIQRVGLYVYVFPLQNQARRVVWNGIDGQGKKFIDAWPRELIASKSNAEMRLHLKNGSVVQILGSDDPDKLVGMNPVGLVYSEYAMANPMSWKLVSPILAENGGWVVFNSTPRGMNHFSKMLNHAKANAWDRKTYPPKANQWFWQHETAKTLKVLTPEDLRVMRGELGDEALFQQEAFCSFSSPMQGAYYDNQLKFLRKNGRIGKVPADPRLPVHTGWDLGIDDATAIWFAQVHGREVRLVHYYENSGEGLPHYARYLKDWAADNNLSYGFHYAPHDISVRELTSGKSRLESAKSMGLRFRPVKKHAVEDGIEQTRNFLPQCWIDAEGCERGVDCLASYRKEWDPLHAVFKTRPLHDWGMKVKDHRDKKSQPQAYSDEEYSVFG